MVGFHRLCSIVFIWLAVWSVVAAGDARDMPLRTLAADRFLIGAAINVPQAEGRGVGHELPLALKRLGRCVLARRVTASEQHCGRDDRPHRIAPPLDACHFVRFVVEFSALPGVTFHGARPGGRHSSRLASSSLVNRKFAPSQSSFFPLRTAMLPSRQTSVTSAAWSTKLDPAGGPPQSRYQGTWFRKQPERGGDKETLRMAMRLPVDGEEAEQIIGRARTGAAAIESIESEVQKMAPLPLYDLTELQRHANRLFGFSAQQTLDVAQALYERHKREGNLLPESQFPFADAHGQYRFNYRHPHIESGKEENYLLDAFRRDFEVNGPSLLRLIRVLLNGWQTRKLHSRRVRDRLAWEVSPLRSTYAGAVWAMMRYYHLNPRLRERSGRLLADMYAEFGWKTRLVAPLIGRYVYNCLKKEEERLAAGYAYEPRSFCEKNAAALALERPIQPCPRPMRGSCRPCRNRPGDERMPCPAFDPYMTAVSRVAVPIGFY